MENAKKNLVFHFGVGRQAAFYRIDYVKYLEVLTAETIQGRKLLAEVQYVDSWPKILLFRTHHL